MVKNIILSDDVNKTTEIVLNRNGPIITTENGNTFFEISGGSHSSFLVNHHKTVVNRIVEELIKTTLPINGRSYVSRWQYLLASRINNELSFKNNKIYFTSGGTEGIETAIRISLAIQRSRNNLNKKTFITRENSYHGMSVFTRLISDHPIHSKEDFSDIKMVAATKLKEPTCNECPFSLKRSNCNLKCADELNTIISEKGADGIAGIILEPIGGTTSGSILPPEGYLKRIQEICNENQIIFIADEVITSFYRSGKMFFTENIDIDIRVGGKCLSGGFAPICSLVFSENLINSIPIEKKLPLRLTFSGNPLVCMIAEIVQDTIFNNNFKAQICSQEKIIKQHLEAFCNNKKELSFTGIGLLWSIHLKCNEPTSKVMASKFKNIFNKKGLEIMTGFKKNSIHFMFTPAIDLTINQLKNLLQMFTTNIKLANNEISY